MHDLDCCLVKGGLLTCTACDDGLFLQGSTLNLFTWNDMNEVKGGFVCEREGRRVGYFQDSDS